MEEFFNRVDYSSSNFAELDEMNAEIEYERRRMAIMNRIYLIIILLTNILAGV